MKTNSDERGFAAIWVAITLLFLMASAALAVDVAGFYETARTDQISADLACLAGVPHLPESAATARAAAAENVQRNFPSLAAATATTVGSTLTLTDGSGSTAVITTPVGSDNAKMQVVITETDPATFGRAIGASQVPVTQQAFCKVFSGGNGNVPFGAMPGGWDGQLQDSNPCGTNSGNCGRLFVPRDDVNGAGPQTEENIASGLDRALSPGLWPSMVGCGAISAGGNCNVVETNTGVNAAALGQGFRRRLSNTAGASQTFTYGGTQYNADTPAQILGGTPTALAAAFGGAPPPGWEEWIHGVWGTVDVTNHFYWNDVVAKCDSPRLISFPIVSEDLTWSEAGYFSGKPFPGWPNGDKSMLVVGLYNGILVNPNGPEDFIGSGNLKEADSVIMWFGPDARCVGPNGSTTAYSPGGLKTYRLVDANA
jgi:Flp pilus assembly protein TadG